MSATVATVPRWVPSKTRVDHPLCENPNVKVELSDDKLPSKPSFPFGNHPSTLIPFHPSHYQGDNRSTQSAESVGVVLSWEDLWVYTNGEKKDEVPILAGITGFALPSQVLAIMGPSGCGKSTLLDVLAGRLASNLRRTGQVFLDGRKRAMAYGTSAYVTQEDVLMTTLTVREAVQYAAELQLPSSMDRAAKMQRAEETLQEMGLTGVAGVRIGGRVTKGISGGQKRRVSICMEIITRPKLLFLDEPTSGLDSAAAFHVMSRIWRMAESERMTVVAAVHQPTAEVFDVFSSVCLLAYGRTVFFGPPAHAAEFFASNGFPCPSLKNPSDHYLRTINKDFEGARGSMLMFIAAFLTFMAIGGFPSFVEEMKIFGRERLNGHYDVTAFTLANTLSSIPYLAIISVVPGAIAYYLVGLQSSIDRFIYFVLVLFACMMLVEGLMMTVASIVPDFLMGIITGAGIQGVMMLNGGFFRLPHDLPETFWRYPVYYIAFHKYAFQGFYKNEFMGLTFPNNKIGEPPTITGEQILRDTWQVEMGHSKWVDLAILFGMTIFYRILFLVIMKAWPKMKGYMARLPRESTSVSFA
ncbi:hypothetical protein HPP92_011213 [Vanilla planifolia]|uniref:ABC transporter domain-containing protein n=1 Tax=Vanilla planifolia TaxID=51239 RepID=A0A835V1K2_VANPL|nr:hypothetical protein HPP92_011213 [Vanilla planifolia]